MGWQDAPVVDAGAGGWRAAPVVSPPASAPPQRTFLQNVERVIDPTRVIPAIARGVGSAAMDIFKMPGDVYHGEYQVGPGPRLDTGEAVGAKPPLEPAARGEALALAGGGTPVGRAAIEAGGALAAKGAAGAARAATAPARVIGAATGKAAKSGAEELRADMAGKLGGEIAGQEATAAAARREAAKVITLRRIGEAQRGAAIEARQQATKDLAAAHQRAGASREQAANLVMEDAGKVAQANQAVEHVEQQMLSQPTAGAEVFGRAIQNETRAMADRLERIRSQESGMGEAIMSAGDEPRVPTASIVREIDAAVPHIANDQTKAILGKIRRQLITEGAAPAPQNVFTNAMREKRGLPPIASPGPQQTMALPVRKADSLRKTINDALSGKEAIAEAGKSGVGPEAAHYLRAIRKDLVKSLTDSWAPYKIALGKWSTLSRPLDILERQGALRKIISTDAISEEYAMTEAQVAGAVIRKAAQGHPVFERLLEESPGLRGPARLYFANDLFGKGKPPTPAVLRTWLRNNERPLRQFGLYDEFSTMQAAHNAALDAVKEAKGVRAESMAQLRAARSAEAAAAKRKAVAEHRLKLAESRPGAEILGTRLREAEAAETGAKAAAKSLSDLRSDLARARPDDVAGVTKSTVDKLRSLDRLTVEQRDEYLKRIQGVQDKYGQTAEARRRLRQLGYAALAAAAGYGAYAGFRAGQALLP